MGHMFGRTQKRIIYSLFVGVVTLFLTASASLSYTGPNRPATTCAYPNNTIKLMSQRGNRDNNSCNVFVVGEIWCNDPSASWNLYPKLPFAYQACESYPTLWIDEATMPTFIYSPPATVSGSISCSSQGTNGWCKSGSATFSANEPMSGQQITVIEAGAIGTVCSINASSGSCTVSPPDGDFSGVNFWAVSSYGDTSTSSQISWKFDRVPPSLSISNPPAPDGNNGWYRTLSPTYVVSGSDATSGLASASFSDGTTTKTISTDGTFSLTATATDNAGNTASSVYSVKKDNTNPTANIPTNPDGNNGWYKTSPPAFSIIGSDVTSGVASALFNDGNPTKTVTAEGITTITGRVFDNAGNQISISKDISKDTVSPTLSVSPSDLPDGNNGWYRNILPTFTLTSSDSTSGISTSRFDSNGSTSWTAGGEQNYTLVARATDKAGNVTIVNTPVKIDKTPPEVFVIRTNVAPWIAEDGSWHSNALTLSIQTSDSNSGIESAVFNNGQPTMTISSDGTYTVTATTTDNAGNSSSKTITLNVDSSAPSLLLSPTPLSDGLNGWYRAISPSLSPLATDSGSGIMSVFFDDQPSLNNPTRTYSTDGVYSESATAKDKLGNAAHASTTIKKDSTPPIITIQSSPDGSNGWYVTKPTLSLTSSDATSGISTALFSNGLPTYTITGADGFYSLHATAIDNAGNSTNADESLQVDTTAPNLSFNQTPDGKNGWFVTFPTFTLTANDSTSGLNGTALFNNGQPTFGISTDGIFSVGAHASDLAGNSTSIAKNMSVDTTPPTVSFNVPYVPDGQNGWYITKPSITLDSTDVTSGVATALFDTGNTSLTVTDGTQTLSATAEDKAGNKKSITGTINVDTVLPTMSPTTSGSGSNGWYNTDITVYANASDSISGIEKTEHRVDGGAWVNGDSSTITSNGNHTVDFRATDKAGLIFIISTSVDVDRTPPSISYSENGTTGENGWYISPVVLSINSNDSLSGIDTTEYRVNNGTWTSGNTVSLSEGTPLVESRSTDKAGNISPIYDTNSLNIKIDTTNPTINPSISGTKGLQEWYTSDVIISSNASDSTSGINFTEYRIDGGNWQIGDSPSITENGSHTIDFRTTDNAGRTSTDTISFVVDKTPPSVSFTPTGSIGNNGWYVGTVDLLINVSDDNSGVSSTEYRIDGGTWTNGNDLTLSEGNHTVEARSTDNAGNISVVSSAETIAINVDTTNPGITIELNGTQGLNSWFVSSTEVLANATDATSGIALTEYRLDNGAWQTGNKFTVSLDSISHTVDARVTDKAGNSASTTRSFKLDTTIPLSTFIYPPEGQGIKATGIVNFTGKSIDTLSGLRTTEMSLDNGKSWSSLPNTDGEWNYSWNTSNIPDGVYTVMVRASDNAGNVEHTAKVQVNVGNLPPVVEINSSWWFWETGYVKIEKRQIDIRDASLRISCSPSHPDVVVSYNSNNIPSEIKWDKRCGDGVVAASGNYFVTVQVCDVFNHCSSASGTIKIPFISIPVPTWTPTAKPTATPIQTYVYVYSSPTVTPRATSTTVPTATSTSTPAWPKDEIKPTMNPTSTSMPTRIPVDVEKTDYSLNILWMSILCGLLLIFLLVLFFLWRRRKKNKDEKNSEN